MSMLRIASWLRSARRPAALHATAQRGRQPAPYALFFRLLWLLRLHCAAATHSVDTHAASTGQHRGFSFFDLEMPLQGSAGPFHL